MPSRNSNRNGIRTTPEVHRGVVVTKLESTVGCHEMSTKGLLPPLETPQLSSLSSFPNSKSPRCCPLGSLGGKSAIHEGSTLFSASQFGSFGSFQKVMGVAPVTSSIAHLRAGQRHWIHFCFEPAIRYGQRWEERWQWSPILMVFCDGFGRFETSGPPSGNTVW